jgi:hypothetical protein
MILDKDGLPEIYWFKKPNILFKTNKI